MVLSFAVHGRLLDLVRSVSRIFPHLEQLTVTSGSESEMRRRYNPETIPAKEWTAFKCLTSLTVKLMTDAWVLNVLMGIGGQIQHFKINWEEFQIEQLLSYTPNLEHLCLENCTVVGMVEFVKCVYN